MDERSNSRLIRILARLVSTTLIVAGIIAAATLADAQTPVAADAATSFSPSAASTGRAIDAPRTRSWLRIEPGAEIQAYEIAPRTESDHARVGEFLRNHPGLSGASVDGARNDKRRAP